MTFPRIGAATVVTFGLAVTLLVLLCLGSTVGWNPIWQSLGVTPLPPPFWDTQVVIDYADCAAKGVDPYRPHACHPANLNIPPIWLWLGLIAVGKNAAWFACGMTAAAAVAAIALFKGRPAADGVIALVAILSPSVLMGVERGNPDFLIFAITAAAALIYNEQKTGRASWAVVLTTLALILKLFPMFTAALAIRGNRRDVFYGIVLSVISLIYLLAIFKYILLIRANVPTTFILSYGYKSIFLGLDQLRVQAGLPALGLADTWLPVLVAALALICAAAAALINVRSHRVSCQVATNMAGTAFIFGSAIYCGTFLLGTNFVYRLTFLLLCLPQLQDWCRQESEKSRPIMCWLLMTLLAVLWLSSNANGHVIFLIAPQLFGWLLFTGLAAVLFSNAFENVAVAARSGARAPGAK